MLWHSLSPALLTRLSLSWAPRVLEESLLGELGNILCKLGLRAARLAAENSHDDIAIGLMLCEHLVCRLVTILDVGDNFGLARAEAYEVALSAAALFKLDDRAGDLEC